MDKQRVLIVGKGGREHAMAWKLAQSPRVGELFMAPGNGGTEDLGQNVPIEIDEVEALLKFAVDNKIDLTVVGEDLPLALGIVDKFTAAGKRIFGPSQAAAEIEWSKAFSKELMDSKGIPTASSRIYSDYGLAVDYLKEHELPVVIKASGLARGKGVYICRTKLEVKQALQDLMVKQIFGESGLTVVIEDYLDGPEASIHAVSDGSSSQLFPTSRDYKPIGDGDTGPNSAGMGAYCPVPELDSKFTDQVNNEVVRPVLSALEAAKRPFKGCLYPGLKLTADGLKVLEYNSRFGDPEMQVYMRLLETDLLDIIEACIDGKLDKLEIKWRPGYAVCVVTASAGYPGAYKVNRPIYGIDRAYELPDIVIFQAGTSRVKRRLVTSGGRVMGVTAVGKTLEEAVKNAYAAVDRVQFQGMQFRSDIGKPTKA